MTKIKTIALVMLLIASACSAQIIGVGNRKVKLVSVSSHFTLHSGVVCSGGTASGASVGCTLTGVSAGDLITVQIGQIGVNSAACDFTHVTDNLNSGNYTAAWANQSDPTDSNCISQAYFLNSASGNVTLSAAFSAAGWSHIAAQAWTDSAGGASATYDMTFSDGGSFPFFTHSAGATDANCGTAKTPSAGNELVIAYAEGDNQTWGTGVTGANFTGLTTSQTSNPSAAQYWIQTTATATNGAFANPDDDWGAGCVAFKP
jgi:hypothetical protein